MMDKRMMKTLAASLTRTRLTALTRASTTQQPGLNHLTDKKPAEGASPRYPTDLARSAFLALQPSTGE